MSSSIIAYTTDLIFATKIRSTAEALHCQTQMVRSPESLREFLQKMPSPLILIDLNAEGNPLEAVHTALRTAPDAHLIAYCSHVQTELAEKAKEAGVQEVLARSTFSARLPEILGSAGSP